MHAIPRRFLNSVVAVGVNIAECGSGFRWVGSGFLYGRRTAPGPGPGQYWVYAVTNRHVAECSEHLFLRFNTPVGVPGQPYPFPPMGAPPGDYQWCFHPCRGVDVAVVPINIDHLREVQPEVDFFHDDLDSSRIGSLRQDCVGEGDGVCVLGFPLGLAGESRNVVIARTGAIARIEDELVSGTHTFLLDVFTFPGNSGGPVVLRPPFRGVEAALEQTSARLIGLVSKYITYEDVAVSLQTRKPRVVFQENSGLAEAHFIDFVDEAITHHLDHAASSPPNPTQPG